MSWPTWTWPAAPGAVAGVDGAVEGAVEAAETEAETEALGEAGPGAFELPGLPVGGAPADAEPPGAAVPLSTAFPVPGS